MKRFLAIYIGTAAALEKAQWEKMDEEKRKALEASGVEAWMDWGEANSAAIVDQGSRTNDRGTQHAGDAFKRT